MLGKILLYFAILISTLFCIYIFLTTPLTTNKESLSRPSTDPAQVGEKNDVKQKVKEIQEELNPKFQSLMSSMQKMMSEGKPPSNDEKTLERYQKVMQLSMSAMQLGGQSSQLGQFEQYQLRLWEIVRDMINEAYDEADHLGILLPSSKEAQK